VDFMGDGEALKAAIMGRANDPDRGHGMIPAPFLGPVTAMRYAPTRLAALSLVAALMSASALAQTPPAKPAAKPAAKPRVTLQAAPGAVVTAKPKVKLMSRDELRACFDRRDANEAEAIAVQEAEKLLIPEREAIVKDAATIKQRDAELVAEQKTIQLEMATMTQRATEVQEQIKKAENKKEAEALRAEYQKQADAVNARIEPHNAKRKEFRELIEKTNLDARVDAFNKNKEELGQRFDKLGDAQDAWRNECGNKPYDEADEIALNKERAAKKAAAAAAGAASAASK
jgi:regulator of replication initiation timing